MKKGMLVFPFLLILAGCTLVEVNLFPRERPLKEVTLMGEGEARVVLVDVSGFLSTSRGSSLLGITSRPSIVERVRRVLDRAAKDSRVKGLLLRINSPGGTVTAADILYHEISTEARRHKWPVVACLMEVAASGGYYVALSADRVVAHPTTVTGAVGVIALKLDIQGLLRKVGVRVEVYKSGAEKDTWFPFRPSTPEEERHIQEMIQAFSGRFFRLVEERRHLSESSMAQVKTGRVFPASLALKLGLVDKTGYMEDAFSLVRKLAGLKKARLVAYLPPGKAQANVYSGPLPSARGWLDLLTTGEAAYLWVP